MRVLILAQYFPPDLGGSSTRAYNVARGLVLNGVDTTVVTSYPHYPHGFIPREYARKPFTVEQMNGVKVIRTLMIPVESKGLLRRLATFVTFMVSSLQGLLLVRDIDAVWVANPDIFGIVPGLIFKAFHRCPIIFNVDDLSIEDIENLKMMRAQSLSFRLARRVSSLLYRVMDAVTPISPGYYESIERLGVRKDKIFLVLGGVDLDVFKPQQNTRSSVFKVAYSGSFSVAYDFDQIIRAAELLRDEGVEFLIQGKGEQGPAIREAIREKRLVNVILFDTILTREQVAKHLREADSLILPLKDFNSPYLGISSKLYEYQALGKPVICCSRGNSADYILDTGSGLIIEPGNHEGLAEAIRLLHSNPEMAEEMGRAGREYVETHVGVEQIGGAMKQVLEHVVEAAA